MKKLMIAAAIVCATVMAQASSVTWNSGSTKFVDATGATATTLGGDICLIVLADNTGWAAGTWTAAKGSVTELGTATLGTGKSAGKVTGETYQFDYGTAQQKITDGSVLAVVFKDSAGAYNQLVYYSDKSAVTETLTVAGLADDQSLWSKTLQFGQGSAKTGGITSQAVPEPTSAMLLLLGVAGLALRRRRA